MQLAIENTVAFPGSVLKPSGLTITTTVPTCSGRLTAPALSLSTSLSSTLAPSTLTSPTLAGTPYAITPCTLASPSPRSPQAHLPALPHELLLIILSHLDDESLYALTQTSRSLHYLIIPYLLNKYDVQDPQRGWVVLFNHPVQIIPILRSALFFHSPCPTPSTLLSPTTPTSPVSHPPSSPIHPHSPTRTTGPEPTSASVLSSGMLSPDSCSWSGDGGYRDGNGGITQIHVHFVGGKGSFRRFYHDARALGRLMQNNGHGYSPTTPVAVTRPDRNGLASRTGTGTAPAFSDAETQGGVEMKLLKLHLSNLDSWVSELRYRVMGPDEDEEDVDDGVVVEEGNGHADTQYELAQESINDPQAHAHSHSHDIIDINLNSIETATTGTGSAYQTDIGNDDRSDNGTENEADADSSTQPHGHGGRLSCQCCGSSFKLQDEHEHTSSVGHHAYDAAHKYRGASKYRYPQDISRISNKEIDIVQWRKAVVELLETAIRKGCQELEVRSGQRLMSVYRLNGNKIGLKEMESLDAVESCIRPGEDGCNNTGFPDVSGTTAVPSQGNRQVDDDLPLEKSFALHKRFGNKVAGILRYLRRRPKENQDTPTIDTLVSPTFPSDLKHNSILPPTTVSAPNADLNNLNSVCFQSTFLLHQPFQSWTVSILNSSPHLTKLSVENIKLGSEQWREVLRKLTLPAIEDICVTQTDGFEGIWDEGGAGAGGAAYTDDDEEAWGVLSDAGSGEGSMRGRGRKAAVGMMLEDLYEFLKRHETKIEKLKILGNFQSWSHRTGVAGVGVDVDSEATASNAESDELDGHFDQNASDPQSAYTRFRSFAQDLFKNLEMSRLREIWAYPLLIGVLISAGPEKLRQLKRITIVSGDQVGQMGYFYLNEDGVLSVAAMVDGGGAGGPGEDESERELRRSDYRWFEVALRDVARFTGGVDAEVHEHEGEVSSPLASPRSSTTRSWKRSFSLKRKNTAGDGSDAQGKVARRTSVRSTTSERAGVSHGTREFILQLQCLSRRGLIPFLLSQSHAPLLPLLTESSSSSSPESESSNSDSNPNGNLPAASGPNPSSTSILASLHNITELQMGTRWYWDFDERVTEVLPRFWRGFPDLRRVVVCDQTEEVRERLFGEEYWRRVGREFGFGRAGDTLTSPGNGDDTANVGVDTSGRRVKLETARFNSMGLQVWNFELGKWTT